MDLKEIGAALREGRERKGMSVEAVEAKIKIAQSVIIALEEGNSERFPHPVYARGFVRSYALLLGLDAGELCVHFSREYPVPVDEDDREDAPPNICVRRQGRRKLPALALLLFVAALGALGGLGWYVYEEYFSARDLAVPDGPMPSVAPAPVESPRPGDQEPSASESGDVAVSLPEPLTQMQEVAANESHVSAEENGTFFSLSTSRDQVGNTQANREIEAGDEEGQAERPVSAAIPEGERRLVIVAEHANSWLEVRPDDRIESYFLRKGESTTVTFSRALSVKFGNAGGVRLTLDGKPYPLEAAMGEVKTLDIR